jgi:ABC-type transporter Mla MlaB component
MTMLRVSYSDNAEGQRWSLCGHLAGPWVDELRTCWQHARNRAPRSRAIVDLSDVTFIDEAGEGLLSEMQSAGTEFIAAGVENKHLLASLKDNGKRPLRKLMEHLCTACAKPNKP